MIIIHGDDTVSARNHLNDLVARARQKDEDVRRFDAGGLDLTQLTQVLEGLTLFGKEPLLVIDGLFSLTKSKNKEGLLEFLKKYQQRNVVFFEGKAISAATLKAFPEAEVKEHKPAAIIFTFLESLRPGSSQKSLPLLSDLEQAGEPSELIFAMLVRQVRLLIQAQQPHTLKVAPWQKNRLTSQARAFGEDALLNLHEKLYRIDKGIKTGKNPVDLSTQIFNLVASL